MDNPAKNENLMATTIHTLIILLSAFAVIGLSIKAFL